MKRPQVFDLTKCPPQWEEYLKFEYLCEEGLGNDTYHRWYPIQDDEPDSYGGHPDEFVEAINEWLIGEGMDDPLLDSYFYVLLHLSW